MKAEPELFQYIPHDFQALDSPRKVCHGYMFRPTCCICRAVLLLKVACTRQIATPTINPLPTASLSMRPIQHLPDWHRHLDSRAYRGFFKNHQEADIVAHEGLKWQKFRLDSNRMLQ